jgi:hypothetical protein
MVSVVVLQKIVSEVNVLIGDWQPRTSQQLQLSLQLLHRGHLENVFSFIPAHQILYVEYLLIANCNTVRVSKAWISPNSSANAVDSFAAAA